jgi:hypothetical protein
MVKSDYEGGRRRNDGKRAKTARGRGVHDARAESTDGRIQRVLGDGGPFTDEFKEAILGDHADILERFYLKSELEGAKRILQALEASRGDPNAERLLREMQSNPVRRSSPCVLCPVWRQEHSIDQAQIASRYFFDAKAAECSLVTIMFGFGANLDELEAEFDRANKLMSDAIRFMTKRHRGVAIIGVMEPDLRSMDELTMKPDLVSAMNAFGRQAPDTGGWVLSGHFLVRAPYRDELERYLDAALPGKGFDRVEFKHLSDNADMEANVMKILEYLTKYPAFVMKQPTRGPAKTLEDQLMSKIVAVFHGFGLNKQPEDRSSFGVQAATRQWALFMDRMGYERIYFSSENLHAQKWPSWSEWEVIRFYDLDMDMRGQSHPIELFRDAGFLHNGRTLKELNRKTLNERNKKLRWLRTRRMRLDLEWHRATDLSDHDFGSQAVGFSSWLFKPKP